MVIYKAEVVVYLCSACGHIGVMGIDDQKQCEYCSHGDIDWQWAKGKQVKRDLNRMNDDLCRLLNEI
jgi:hypothetical protein